MGRAARGARPMLLLLAVQLCRAPGRAQEDLVGDEHAELHWEEGSSWRDIPAGAVYCGFQFVHDDQARREPAYVARLYRDSSLLPGKATYWGGSAATPNSTFSNVNRYQVAVAPARRVQWMAAAGGGIPPAATATGLNREGVPIYSCRFIPERRQSFACGAIQRHTDRCVAEVEGALAVSPVYEVLVVSAPYMPPPAPYPPSPYPPPPYPPYPGSIGSQPPGPGPMTLPFPPPLIPSMPPPVNRRR